MAAASHSMPLQQQQQQHHHHHHRKYIDSGDCLVPVAVDPAHILAFVSSHHHHHASEKCTGYDPTATVTNESFLKVIHQVFPETTLDAAGSGSSSHSTSSSTKLYIVQQPIPAKHRRRDIEVRDMRSLCGLPDLDAVVMRLVPDCPVPSLPPLPSPLPLSASHLSLGLGLTHQQQQQHQQQQASLQAPLSPCLSTASGSSGSSSSCSSSARNSIQMLLQGMAHTHLSLGQESSADSVSTTDYSTPLNMITGPVTTSLETGGGAEGIYDEHLSEQDRQLLANGCFGGQEGVGPDTTSTVTVTALRGAGCQRAGGSQRGRRPVSVTSWLTESISMQGYLAMSLDSTEEMMDYCTVLNSPLAPPGDPSESHKPLTLAVQDCSSPKGGEPICKDDPTLVADVEDDQEEEMEEEKDDYCDGHPPSGDSENDTGRPTHSTFNNTPTSHSTSRPKKTKKLDRHQKSFRPLLQEGRVQYEIWVVAFLKAVAPVCLDPCDSCPSSSSSSSSSSSATSSTTPSSTPGSHTSSNSSSTSNDTLEYSERIEHVSQFLDRRELHDYVRSEVSQGRIGIDFKRLLRRNQPKEPSRRVIR